MNSEEVITTGVEDQKDSAVLPEWVLSAEEQRRLAALGALDVHSPRSTLKLTITAREGELVIVSEQGTASLYLCLLAPRQLSGEMKAAVNKWLFISDELAYLRTARLIEVRSQWQSEYY